MENIIRRNGINTVSNLINQIISIGMMLPTTFKSISDYLDTLEERWPGDSEIIGLRNRLNAI